MLIDNVYAVYFSATGTTQKVVAHIASILGQRLGATTGLRNFTLPTGRIAPLVFARGDLIVFGTPVYAGRIPNLLLKYLETMQGHGALAVTVALFGNRSYDDALIEQRDLLERTGFHVVAAGAFVGEHSFSTVLAAGRPDAEDMALARRFAVDIAAKIQNIPEGAKLNPVPVKGTPYPHAGYYRPLDPQGNFMDLRKVKPLVGDRCTGCNICVALCPMGSISRDDLRECIGICIKCGACIKGCPENARSCIDEGYLYHKRDLEERYARPARPELFI